MAKNNLLKDRVTEKLQRITKRQLRLVHDFIAYLEDREAWEATQELLTDAGMRRDVEEGVRQGRSRRGKSWRQIKCDV